MKKGDEFVRVDLLDVLLDEKNTMPTFMYDTNGRQFVFEQVAVIPYGDDDLYCILKPITKVDGIGDDEAVVFKVDTDEDGEAILRVESNERIAIEIFDRYYALFKENAKKTNS